MIIQKQTIKLIIPAIMAACAVFICALFLNYRQDLLLIEDQLVPEQMVYFESMKTTSVVVCAVAGGCLLITTAIMLIFYVKHYIDTHKKQLGILKALGYSRIKIASNFWIFGVSVLIGTSIGLCGAFGFMPLFYDTQNKEHMLPEVTLRFHAELLVFLVILPTVFFAVLGIVYALFKLKMPVLLLIKDNFRSRNRRVSHIANDGIFTDTLRKTTLKSRKSLIFFIVFASFCYGAMTQMSLSMNDFASPLMGGMMLVIGLLLSFVTLFLAVTTVIDSNTQTIAMMKVFGYSQADCRHAILDGYRPLSYIGFGIGTVYQYALLRIMVDVIFADMDNIPAYEFDFAAMLASLVSFVVIYELIMAVYSAKIKKITVKEIMLR
ncbi:MAG: FtsX-like permease family protein [Butyrivibrio sp.]|nr:FtsX-like permease family protein [Butyrivibrio sp.]